VYGYPRQEAAEVASRAIEEFLLRDTLLREVRLVFFSEPDLETFLKYQQFSI
jgi:O-acetyl-ADP-ribose deacetylase (regulator of RNase III)